MANPKRTKQEKVPKTPENSTEGRKTRQSSGKTTKSTDPRTSDAEGSGEEGGRSKETPKRTVKITVEDETRKVSDETIPPKENNKNSGDENGKTEQIRDGMSKERSGTRSRSVSRQRNLEEDLEYRDYETRKHNSPKKRNTKNGKGRKNSRPKSKFESKRYRSRSRSPLTERSSADETDSTGGRSTDWSDSASEGELSSDSNSEISMNIGTPGTTELSSDEEDRQKKAVKRRTKERKSRSRSRSRGRSRTRYHKSRHSDRERSTSRAKESRDKETKTRKRKRKRESDSEEEELHRLMCMVKRQLKQTRRKRKSKSKTNNISIQKRGIPGVNVVKSPSEPSVYSPALKQNYVPRAERLNRERDLTMEDRHNEVAQFLSKMRLFPEKDSRSRDRKTDSDSDESPTRGHGSSSDAKEMRKTGRQLADELIIQAEKQKARILPNPGTEKILDRVDPNNMNHLESDGEFMHITCHIDDSLRARIQRGEFVELEKLLKKPKFFKGSDSEKVEMINKEGKSFCSLSLNTEETVKITHVRKWEQAFRVYATIYSQANPAKASEIFQYINVITEAARKFVWDCVAYYDFTFRHMMHDKPNRSWAKPFPELWSISMTEPLFRPGNGAVNQSSQNRPKRDWRDGCCWKFNKTSCPYGRRCRFEHRCTYCGSTNHPLSQCAKRSSKSERGEHREKRDSRSKRNKNREEKGNEADN